MQTEPFRVNMLLCFPGKDTSRGLCPWRLGKDASYIQQQPHPLPRRQKRLVRALVCKVATN